MNPIELSTRRCKPCTGQTPPLTPAEIRVFQALVPEWSLTDDGKRIVRSWRVKNFLVGLDFFRRIAELAENEDHHPDLHLVNYREVTVELWTHAVGGLTENDFIMAAKIDTLEVELKR